MIEFPCLAINASTNPADYGITIGDPMLYKSIFLWLHNKISLNKYGVCNNQTAKDIYKFFSSNTNIPDYKALYYKNGPTYDNIVEQYNQFVRYFNNNPYRRCLGMYFDSEDLSDSFSQIGADLATNNPINGIFSNDLDCYFVKCVNAVQQKFIYMPLGFIFDYCGDLLSNTDCKKIRQLMLDDAKMEMSNLPAVDRAMIEKAEHGINKLLVDNRYAKLIENTQSEQLEQQAQPNEPKDEEPQDAVGSEVAPDRATVDKNNKYANICIYGLKGGIDKINVFTLAKYWFFSVIAVLVSALFAFDMMMIVYFFVDSSIYNVGWIIAAFIVFLFIFTFTMFNRHYRYNKLHSLLYPFNKSKKRILNIYSSKDFVLPNIKINKAKNNEYLLSVIAEGFNKFPFLNDYKNLFRNYSKVLTRKGSGKMNYGFGFPKFLFVVSIIGLLLGLFLLLISQGTFEEVFINMIKSFGF